MYIEHLDQTFQRLFGPQELFFVSFSSYKIRKKNPPVVQLYLQTFLPLFLLRITYTISIHVCSFHYWFHSSTCSFFCQVLSVTLDDWSDSDIDSMLEIGGNSYANSIYESFLPKDHPKPKMDSTMEYRTKFIRFDSYLSNYM